MGRRAARYCPWAPRKGPAAPPPPARLRGASELLRREGERRKFSHRPGCAPPQPHCPTRDPIQRAPPPPLPASGPGGGSGEAVPPFAGEAVGTDAGSCRPKVNRAPGPGHRGAASSGHSSQGAHGGVSRLSTEKRGALGPAGSAPPELSGPHLSLRCAPVLSGPTAHPHGAPRLPRPAARGARGSREGPAASAFPSAEWGDSGRTWRGALGREPCRPH